MAWIKVYQSLTTHRKTLHAADLLGMRPVHLVGHLVAFWLWALDNEPDGNLNGTSARIVAYAAQWDGDPAVFVDALMEAGFLSYDGNGNMVIHDWHDYAGKLIDRRETERERQRRVRSTLQQHTQDVPATYAPRVEKSREDIHATHGAVAPVADSAPAKNGKLLTPTQAVFGALVEVCGYDLSAITPAERGELNKAASDLVKGKRAPADVRAMATNWPALMRDCTMTPSAIAKHATRLLRPPNTGPRASPPVDFDQQRAKFRQELESPL